MNELEETFKRIHQILIPEINLNELKPCPFCGGHSYFDYELFDSDRYDTKYFKICCSKCFIEMTSKEPISYNSYWFTKNQLERKELEVKKELELRWNTRI